MKHLLLVLPLLFCSCQKEEIQPQTYMVLPPIQVECNCVKLLPLMTEFYTNQQGYNVIANVIDSCQQDTINLWIANEDWNQLNWLDSDSSGTFDQICLDGVVNHNTGN